ncbi:hypothetical protein DFP72DRAFT_1074623 [Ephemerocybe angulata]|uniref:Uncharacterized protein n=1 Tax=Ephemerocybe angulata TaxID=980116 RepID=A0A8H6LZ09_9AGAR|nr:hypothetical protein DFP72DRAFT_1074623 [Tulosesus angulatus]
MSTADVHLHWSCILPPNQDPTPVLYLPDMEEAGFETAPGARAGWFKLDAELMANITRKFAQALFLDLYTNDPELAIPKQFGERDWFDSVLCKDFHNTSTLEWQAAIFGGLLLLQRYYAIWGQKGVLSGGERVLKPAAPPSPRNPSSGASRTVPSGPPLEKRSIAYFPMYIRGGSLYKSPTEPKPAPQWPQWPRVKARSLNKESPGIQHCQYPGRAVLLIAVLTARDLLFEKLFRVLMRHLDATHKFPLGTASKCQVALLRGLDYNVSFDERKLERFRYDLINAAYGHLPFSTVAERGLEYYGAEFEFLWGLGTLRKHEEYRKQPEAAENKMIKKLLEERDGKREEKSCS